MEQTSAALYTARIRAYLDALERGDAAALLALFAPGARIVSPLAGTAAPADFYPKLFAASSPSRITLLDIAVSTTGSPHATAYFQYDWVLRDGAAAPFRCVDVFGFDAEARIAELVIVYDTHPIREAVGTQFS
ncbi:nuclear transport factor 2 family protein [Burkholderia gladioli]|uniref:nuclear transport factor 2 family protein n=1 Tax=Burkholderia gladioli TaxID=28095 RepID=UPI00164179FC|nr:nuclear transport factor 2 family protein [Burkholderia gladioli]